MSESPDDMDDLKRLYADTARDEPPAALDAAILAQARREAEAPLRRPWLAWRPQLAAARTPLALAAVVVMTVSLVLGGGARAARGGDGNRCAAGAGNRTARARQRPRARTEGCAGTRERSCARARAQALGGQAAGEPAGRGIG